MSEQTQTQLEVLGQVGAVLSPLRIRFWLRGGWAVDLLLGETTRTHADLDLVTWARHRRRVQRALMQAGFRLVRETEVQVDFCKDDQALSFVFLARARDGRVVTHGIPEWTWRPDALPLRRRHLHGVSAYVVSPQQLLDEKEGYERGTGRPPRPKDLESMKILRRITSAD